jgi:hypothetical protein
MLRRCPLEGEGDVGGGVIDDEGGSRDAVRTATGFNRGALLLIEALLLVALASSQNGSVKSCSADWAWPAAAALGALAMLEAVAPSAGKARGMLTPGC